MYISEKMVSWIGYHIGLPLFIAVLFLIIWNLSREAKAGKFVTIMMFVTLGAGIVAFLLKEVVIVWLSR